MEKRNAQLKYHALLYQVDQEIPVRIYKKSFRLTAEKLRISSQLFIQFSTISIYFIIDFYPLQHILHV